MAIVACNRRSKGIRGKLFLLKRDASYKRNSPPVLRFPIPSSNLIGVLLKNLRLHVSMRSANAAFPSETSACLRVMSGVAVSEGPDTRECPSQAITRMQGFIPEGKMR